MQSSALSNMLIFLFSSSSANTSRSSDNISPLFGSCANMQTIFSNLVNLFTQQMSGIYRRQHEAWSLARAVYSASMMCSTNPALLIGVSDWCGEVKVGMRANLVLVRIDRCDDSVSLSTHVPAKNFSVSLQRVWC